MTVGALTPFTSHGRRALLAVAAASECRAVLIGLGSPDTSVPALWTTTQIGPWDILLTGISKSNAAAATALALDPKIHGAVLSMGVAGAYPPRGAALMGSTVAGTRSVMADEGVVAPGGFLDCPAIGFPIFGGPADAAVSDPGLLEALTPHVDATGPIATVSACSGTDELAAILSGRTGAIAESMEGAAVGLVAARRGVAFIELRAISNTTGDRDRQTWDMRAALDRLSDLASGL